MITIAIPTYNRGPILVETIERLLDLEPRAEAIVIADQTPEHRRDVHARLDEWHRTGAIQWLRLEQPSIPRAMNDALLAAKTPLVLFFDDDIIPDRGIVQGHVEAHRDGAIWAVAGQVLQPGEEPREVEQRGDALQFRFDATRGAFVNNVMAGNLSVKRARALAIGGFDENFVGAAYRFETDFAIRVAAAGGKVWFEPRASLRHLQLATGGLRSYGDHRRAPVPAHSAGDYYFALHHVRGFWRYAARRLAQNVVTRYLLTHPWNIPPKIVGELRGLLLARRLHRKGRALRVVPPENPT
ncbi:MAG TPA: glycosyltransferase [Thermoanaerobaculia bacterium]|nr:glycosyltransferase [Thermoanaerobaculia bacterium]